MLFAVRKSSFPRRETGAEDDDDDDDENDDDNCVSNAQRSGG